MNLAYRILPDGLPSGNMVKGGSVAEIARFPKAKLPDQIEDFGKLAEVVMDNQITNSPLDNGEYQLAMDGLEVGIHFTWDKYQGDDAITITPPDGVICDPADCVLQLPEGKSGMVVLYGWSGS